MFRHFREYHRPYVFILLLLVITTAVFSIFNKEVEVKGFLNNTNTSKHPKIFFNEAHIDTLRSWAQGSHQSIANPIIQYAQNKLDTTPTYPCQGNLGDDPNFNLYGQEIMTFSFAYIATGQQQYLDLTKDYLLAVSAWPSWSGGTTCAVRDSGMATMIFTVSIAYDWIYNDLTDEERTIIATTLGLRANEMYEAATMSYNTEWLNWWGRSYSQNHHRQNLASLGMAALALSGEDSRSTTWLNLVKDEFTRLKFMWEGTADGTWHEGYNYQALGLTWSLAFLFNLRSLDGTDLIPDTYLQNYTYWRIYNSLPNDWRLVMNHSNNTKQDDPWAAGTAFEVQGLLRFIAQEYGDGHAEWIAQHIINTTGRQISVHKTPFYIFEFFYYAAGLNNPVPPTDLPLNRTFSDLEGVIWRTGWGSNDLTFALRTGARGGRFNFNTYTAPGGPYYPYEVRPLINSNVNSGHDHADFNTFYLYRGNNILATEYSNYGSFASSYHNVLLVDGQGQYYTGTNFSPSAFINTDAKLEKNYSTNNFSFLTADNTNTYRPVEANGDPGQKILNESKRHVLFFKPNYLIMVDNVEASSSHQYEWIYHAGSSLSVEGNWIKGQGPNNQILGVNVVAPTGFQNTTGNDGYPYIRVRPANNVNNTRFVTLLYPTDTTGWSNKPTVTLLGENTEIAGVRVVRGGMQEDHLIKYGTASTEVIGSYSLSGETASIITNASSGALDKIFAGKITKITNQNLADQTNSHIVMQSNSPALLEIDHNGTNLFLDGDQVSELVVYGPNISPSSVFLNGSSISVNKIGDYITFGNVPIDILAQITPGNSCLEKWSCGAWSACANNSQFRTCTDGNNCGTIEYRPALTQACVSNPGCTPNWSCGAWSDCSNNQQSRSCSDTNNCGTTDFQPSLSQSCGTTPPPNPNPTPPPPNPTPTSTPPVSTGPDHSDTGRLLALINRQGAAVYYIAHNGKKYVYPDSKTYFSWYSDFNKVERVATSKLDSYADGGVVPYRSSIKLVTHPNTAKVYAVEPDSTIRHIPSEGVAKSFFGSVWAKSVQDVITGFFSVSYKIGDPLGSAWPNGSVVKNNNDYYYLVGQTKRKFAGVGVLRLNGFYTTQAWIANDLSAYQDGHNIISLERPLATFRPNVTTSELLGKDPATLGDSADGDRDGLSNYEETSVWQTNALLPDTDGDSFSDGVEVRGGFNPLGNGTIDNWFNR